MPPNSCQWERSQLGQEGLPLWRKHPQGRHIPLCYSAPAPHNSQLPTFLLGQPASFKKCSCNTTDSSRAQCSLTSTNMPARLSRLRPYLIDTQWAGWAEGQPSPLRPEELCSLTGAALLCPPPPIRLKELFQSFLFHRPREAQWLLSLPQLPSFWKVGVEDWRGLWRGGGRRERKNGPDSGKQEQCQAH